MTCQTDDDLPYVLKHSGETQLIIGSDYGHADSASELEALRVLGKTELSESVVSQIIDDNARRFYGIEAI